MYQLRIKIYCFLTLVLLPSFSFGNGEKYVSTRAQKSEGIYAILRRYLLPTTSYYVEQFKKLNAKSIGPKDALVQNHIYNMPIVIYDFDGNTIRSSLGINDYDHAKKIENYNESVYRAGLMNSSYQESKKLWVPYHLLATTPVSTETKTSPYWGTADTQIKPIDAKLHGNVYYLVSGHGGPDPGAIGTRQGKKLYEDEYAYDITLRLARCLLEHQATVFMIVQDPNDGIRDELILKGDRDEFYLGNQVIDLDVKNRLQKQTEIINTLYSQYKTTAPVQNAIIIHWDSRPIKKRVDIFFYYKKGSNPGKRLAKILLNQIKHRYDVKQPGRGYRGVMTTRNLLVLNEVLPTAVYIELGNIQNPEDQERLILANNRQAIANWLCDGLMKASE